MAAKEGTGSMRRALRAARLKAEGKPWPGIFPAVSPRDKMMRAEDQLIKGLDGLRDAVRDTSQIIRDIQYKGIKK